MRYLTLMVGDSPVGFPLAFVGLAALYQRSDQVVSDKAAWRGLVLAIFVVASMFVFERVTGQYTLEEQMTPSKLAHTLMLGVSIGLMVVVPIALSEWQLDRSNWRKLGAVWAEYAVIIGMTVWLGCMLFDTFCGRIVLYAHRTKEMMLHLE